MKTRNSWNQVSLALSRWIPIVRHLPSGAREGLVLGLAGGALLFAVLGALFGWLNRGSEGAVIGALSGAVAGAILGVIVGAIVGRSRLPQRGTLRVRIELDGPSHGAPGNRRADQRQMAFLLRNGWRVLRISNAKALSLCSTCRSADTLLTTLMEFLHTTATCCRRTAKACTGRSCPMQRQ